MSEMADGMLAGIFCYVCGEDLGEPEGYIRMCPGCQEDYEEDCPIDEHHREQYLME